MFLAQLLDLSDSYLYNGKVIPKAAAFPGSGTPFTAHSVFYTEVLVTWNTNPWVCIKQLDTESNSIDFSQD